MATFTGTSVIYNVHPTDMGQANIDYQSLTPECWLWTGAAPLLTWRRANEINNEIVAADYSRTPLTAHVWTESGATAKLESAPVEFVAVTAPITAKGYILVLRNGTDANSPVLTWGYLDSALQDDKTASPPDKIQLTPNATNGWYIANNV